MNCYVCHLPTSVSIPEAQDSACLVPCCQKCLQSYSVEGALTAAASKIERLELVSSIIQQCEILKEFLEINFDQNLPTLEIDTICELLYKLEKELE